MKPFLTYNEGNNAIQELNSTQAMIFSLVNNNGDQSKSEAMKDLKTNIERFEHILLEFENKDKDEFVSKILNPF